MKNKFLPLLAFLGAELLSACLGMLSIDSCAPLRSSSPSPVLSLGSRISSNLKAQLSRLSGKGRECAQAVSQTWEANATAEMTSVQG